ncbi:MAG: hypothetical protein GQ542_12790 [Desulforhopalus sp.]|nr:hypothetical protein [Desulforhopalus sp.]
MGLLSVCGPVTRRHEPHLIEMAFFMPQRFLENGDMHDVRALVASKGNLISMLL